MLAALLTLASSFIAVSHVAAITYTWDGNGTNAGNGKWSTAVNWDANGIPVSNLATTDVLFGGNFHLTPLMDVNYSIHQLTFASGAGAFNLSSNSATTPETLTIGTGGITNSSSNVQSISSPLVLGAAQTWNASTAGLTINSSATVSNGGFLLTISGASNTSIASVISGAGGLTKSGAGTLVLSNSSNSYTGITTISAGTVSIGTGTNLGTSPGSPVANQVTINGGTLATTGTFTFATNRGITLGASGGTIDVASATTLTAPQIITGTGTLLKAGPGTLVLSGANTYTGATTVSAGVLLVNNTTGSGTGTGAVTVNGSGTTLGGTGSISGTVQISNTAAGAILNPGANSTSAGTLTTGALTLSSVNANTFHIDAFGTLTTDWDKLTSTAAIVLGGTASTLQVNIASGLTFTAGQTYVLLDGTSLTGTFNGINDNDFVTFSGYQFTADYTGTEFDLIAVPEPSTWFAAALALGAIGFSQRKRLRACASSGSKSIFNS